MVHSIINVRTVAIVRPFRVVKKQGTNGVYDAKDILVRVAVNRGYKSTNPKTGQMERPTDFWLVKFTGATAEAFNKYCNFTKPDGSHYSRHLLLAGNFENYEKERIMETTQNVNFGGVYYPVSFSVPVTNNRDTIFIVDDMEFLDANPNPQYQQYGNGYTVENPRVNNFANAMPAPQGYVAPVAVAQPAANAYAQPQTVVSQAPVIQPAVNSVAPVAVQPVVQNAVPQTVAVQPAVSAQAPVAVQPVVTPTANQTVEAVQAVVAQAQVGAETPEVPVVPQGFTPDGGVAPF